MIFLVLTDILSKWKTKRQNRFSLETFHKLKILQMRFSSKTN